MLDIIRECLGNVRRSYRTLALLALLGTNSADAAEQLPLQVQQALEANAASLDVIGLSWEEQRTSRFPQAEVIRRLGPTAGPELFLPFRMIFFARQDGMHYNRRAFQYPTPSDESRVATMEAEFAFDKQYFYSGTIEPTKPDAGDALLSIESIELTSRRVGDRRLFRSEYFRDAGFELGCTARTIAQPARSLLLARLQRGAKANRVQEDQLGGVRCLLVELADDDHVSRFHLDPNLGYAVRRHEDRTKTGKVKAVLTNSRFIRLDHTQTWLPTLCVTQWYTWPAISEQVFDQALLTTTIRASNLSNRRLPPEQFRLNYKRPGTIVSSAKVPGAEKSDTGWVTYRIPADPSHLDESIQAALEEQVHTPVTKRRRLALIAGTLFLLLAVGVYWARRQAQRGR